jgi:DNA-binding protein HU-beta
MIIQLFLASSCAFTGGGKIMNKTDIINEVAEILASKKEAQAAVDCIFDTITKTLVNQGTVSLAGFGTFKTASRKARTGRNPRTGEEIAIKAKNVPRFVPGKALKDTVNEDLT